VSAAIIGSQMRYLRQADLGFKKDQQLILPLRSNNARKLYTPLKTGLANTSGFISVGASLFYPGTRNFNSYFNAEGKNASDNVDVNINLVDLDFLKTLGLQPMAGHLFSREFPADSADGIIVNENAIKAFGYTLSGSIGKRLIFSANTARTYKIVGVVKDFHFQDLHSQIGNIGFLINSNPAFNYIIANFSSDRPERAIASARNVWQRLNPNEPFEYNFLDEQFQKHYEADTRVANIVTYATVIAIFISCLGLFGLTAFSAEQRRKEIGIRMVLGASQANLISLLSKDFLKLVLISVFIGTPLGWFVVNKWMENFAYRANISWTLFLFTTLGSLLIALLTISFQAIRASLASPVKSLRTE
jgi:putative ABC transport system permease protein